MSGGRTLMECIGIAVHSLIVNPVEYKSCQSISLNFQENFIELFVAIAIGRRVWRILTLGYSSQRDKLWLCSTVEQTTED
jgi:hypothetical protein